MPTLTRTVPVAASTVGAISLTVPITTVAGSDSNVDLDPRIEDVVVQTAFVHVEDRIARPVLRDRERGLCSLDDLASLDAPGRDDAGRAGAQHRIR